jgi:hypothetical protein
MVTKGMEVAEAAVDTAAAEVVEVDMVGVEEVAVDTVGPEVEVAVAVPAK